MYPTVEFSRKMMKQLVGLLCLAAALVWGVQHSVQLMGWLRVFLGIVQPFLLGCAIAFVLNLPLRAIERKLLRRWNSAARRPVSLLMSLGFVILVVALVVVMIVPELVEAIADIVQQVPVALERLVLWLNEMAVRYPQLDQSAAVLAQLEENWQIVENALSMLKHGLGSVVSTTIGVAGSVISGVATTFIAFVFSFYLLMQKEKIAGQVKRVLTAYLPPRAAERTVQVCCLLDKNFSSFIAGQCLEAVILGSMFVVSMTLLRMPYAVMVGVLIRLYRPDPHRGRLYRLLCGRFPDPAGEPHAGGGFCGAVPGAAAAGRQLYLPPCGGQLGGSALHLGAGRCYGGRQPVWHRGYAGVHPADLHGLFPAAGQRQCPQCGPCRPERPVSASGRVSDKRKKERTPGLFGCPGR